MAILRVCLLSKALGKLESVPDLGALDWRGTAEVAVRAALAGGAKECDVLVLRRKADEVIEPPPAPAASAGAEEEAGPGPGGAWVGAGWRNRGGTWSNRFLGSVGADGAVALEEGEGELASAGTKMAAETKARV